MQAGTKVKITSINRRNTTPPACDPVEDYWKLVGATGTVVQDPSESGVDASFSAEKRVLVQLDVDVAARGLAGHNRIENSLWLLEEDLLVQ